jgi:hypothetical protein
MSFHFKKMLAAFCMAGILILPLAAKADSIEVGVNAGGPGYYDDDDYGYGYANWTWGIGLGGAVVGYGFPSDYSGGYGLDGNFGIKVDKTLSFLLAADSYLFNTNDSNIYSGEINVMPTIRITLGGHGVKPYFLAGVGLNENITYYETFDGTAYNSTINPVVGGGVGIAFRVGHKLDIYIQGKYEDVLASGANFSYFPIAIGIQFN